MNSIALIAEKKQAYRSCIMREELEHLEAFRQLGIEELCPNKDGALLVNVPLDVIDGFVELYLRVMQPGRWNEYVGPKTGFYFKLPNGETKHVLLTEATELQINEIIRQFVFSWDPQTDVWAWLQSIDIYEDWLVGS